MFKEQNDNEREYFNQDFTPVNDLLKRVRYCLVTGKKLDIDDLDFTVENLSDMAVKEQLLPKL